ncbi:MAG: DUF1565 domain-containing protein [Chitinivibrionales bacterium]|nr:DUF1565 domain-containing protein [Chitinivibrionales bacterium]
MVSKHRFPLFLSNDVFYALSPSVEARLFLFLKEFFMNAKRSNVTTRAVIRIITLVSIFNCFVAAQNTLTVPSKGMRSISRAMIKAKPGDTILVKPGKYREHVIVEPGVTLIAKERFKAVINGKGRGTVVTLGSDAAIIGFEIRNGTHGVLSKGSNSKIEKCLIVNNLGSGVISIGNLCEIKNTYIVYNRGAGIQGQDVRSDGSSAINHNTIAYNASHGIALDGAEQIMVKNNIIAYNERLAVKTGPDSRNIMLINNNFYGNHGRLHVLPSGNFALDPFFTAPKSRDMDFSLLENSPCRKKGDDGKDLGVLIR